MRQCAHTVPGRVTSPSRRGRWSSTAWFERRSDLRGVIPTETPGRSLKLAAFVARNGPPDHCVRLRRTAPHPPSPASALNRLEAPPLPPLPWLDTICWILATALLGSVFISDKARL